jgi:DNA uptake protein ComE-like DNA-binding protein
MNFIKSYFEFNKRQRNGVFFLLFIIVFLQLIFFFVDFSSNKSTSFSNIEIETFQKELDSLELVQATNKKPKIYSFNPNFITDYKGYQLGMSVSEIDKLLAFRKTERFVNSVDEFQKVTGVNDSLLSVISPMFKFPDLVTSPKNTRKMSSKIILEKSKVKKDINSASIEDFIKVYGIGEKLATRIVNYRTKLQGFTFNEQLFEVWGLVATRIVNYRTKLQGFTFNEQLFEVWGLDKEVSINVLNQFEVKDKPIIIKINVNDASFKEVLAIVYLDFELTKKIFNYRDEVAEIQSIDELKKIDNFPLEKFNRIALYLEAK